MGEPGLMFVSGVGGFVGSHVARAFMAAGWHVRGSVRTSPAPPGIEPIYLRGASNRSTLQQGMEGADCVVHAAGLAHAPRATWEELWEGNVGTTIAYVDAAVAAGVRRFVLISSVAAVGAQPPGPINDDCEPGPSGHYGRTKFEAEQVLLSRRDELQPVVLRPPLVYGPGMRGNPARLLRWIRSGLPIPLGAMRNRRSVLGVHNLAAAVMAVVAAQGVGGRAFFASDGEPVTIPEIVRGLARGLGRPAHLVSVPAPLLSGAARLAGALPASTFAAHAIQALTSDLVLDDSALRRATGYGPVTDTAEGLFQTGLAYRDSGPTSKWV